MQLLYHPPTLFQTMNLVPVIINNPLKCLENTLISWILQDESDKPTNPIDNRTNTRTHYIDAFPSLNANSYNIFTAKRFRSLSLSTGSYPIPNRTFKFY
ncbi:hypothetical protein CEXT_521771 [Caerostris extrusa]|uniref:Uncharacterized protein n=1 Tax=Caerostris extrusa TaxID=172846 RepID=A0AAV4VA43_CAEEX|nr:hypothetical protein CEXT_521771 [Caerostris extrusa]